MLSGRSRNSQVKLEVTNPQCCSANKIPDGRRQLWDTNCLGNLLFPQYTIQQELQVFELIMPTLSPLPVWFCDYIYGVSPIMTLPRSLVHLLTVLSPLYHCLGILVICLPPGPRHVFASVIFQVYVRRCPRPHLIIASILFQVYVRRCPPSYYCLCIIPGLCTTLPPPPSYYCLYTIPGLCTTLPPILLLPL